jgi:hypothetical protein
MSTADLSLTIHNGTVTTVTRHPNPDREPHESISTVAEFAEGGLDVASMRFGKYALTMLLLQHRDDFKGTDLEGEGMITEFAIVMRLITLSSALRTNAYVGAIDHLLTHAAHEPEHSREYYNSTWQKTIRPLLASYPSP